MIYPEGDAIRERVHNRYSLVVLAAKRAKQIKEGAPLLIETSSTNPLTIALEEIAVGKVTFTEAVEPSIDDEAAMRSEPKATPALSVEHNFLSVSTATSSSNDQAAGTVSPALAAFLPASETETIDDEESSDEDDDIEGKDSLELLGKAQL